MDHGPLISVVISSGFIDSFNPCAISLLLIYISMLFTLGKTKKEVYGFGFIYIITVYITYLLIGMGLLKASVSFTLYPVSKFVAIIVIIFGILNIKEYFWPGKKFSIRIPLKVRGLVSKYAFEATAVSAVVVGFLISIYEFPCSGGIYLAIVGLISNQRTYWSGFPYLLLYNFMFVLPLIIVFFIATNKIFVERLINVQEKHGKKLHLVLAITMILLGVFILFLVS